MTDDPYHDGGTRGSSGGGASADAARADLVHGITNGAQKYVLIMAAQAGTKGITVAELREATGGLHHGRVSSATTKMHIAGKLVRLVERRNHAHIYVLPEYVEDREVRPYRRQNVKLQVDDVEALLGEHHYSSVTGHCHCGAVIGRGDHVKHLALLIVALSRGEL